MINAEKKQIQQVQQLLYGDTLCANEVATTVMSENPTTEEVKKSHVPNRGRSYPPKDIKLLFAYTAGYCCFPGCAERCVIDETKTDPTVVIGHISHIVAHSEDGPRGKSSLSPKERDSYGNWILLCPTHHTKVDKQPNNYTVEDLKEWKRLKEAEVSEKLEYAVTSVTFVELEAITKAIASKASNSIPNFELIEIPEKLEKNNLSNSIRNYLAIGNVNYKQVEEYVQHISRIDSTFPERLKQGFQNQYAKLRKSNIEGDELFISLCKFSYQKKEDFIEKAACLAVVTYLFITCEIFEK